jgi:hypothetical protein
MKYLILDDDEYKVAGIKDYVETIDEDADIKTFSCGVDLMQFLAPFIYNNKKYPKKTLKDYILFLDWCFPLRPDDYPKAKEGITILTDIEMRNLPLKVIIVSSDKVEEDEYSRDFDKIVLGSIQYNSSCYQLEEFRDLMEKAL